MREFPKSSTLSPNSKAAEYQSLMNLGHNYEPHMAVMNEGQPMYQDYGHVVPENNLDVLLNNLEFETFEQRTHNWQMPGENDILWSGDAPFLDQIALEQRAFEIREKLKYTAATLNAPNLPPKEILDGIDLITADSIAAWVKLYFRHWHKHAPAVHESSFNPCAAAIPLVLALMILGGMVSCIPLQNLASYSQCNLVLQGGCGCSKAETTFGYHRGLHILHSRIKRGI
jgi:hypothetical protein